MDTVSRPARKLESNVSKHVPWRHSALKRRSGENDASGNMVIETIAIAKPGLVVTGHWAIRDIRSSSGQRPNPRAQKFSRSVLPRALRSHAKRTFAFWFHGGGGWELLASARFSWTMAHSHRGH